GEFGAVVPVVLLADVFEPLDVARLSACGADGHITKPFDARTLQLMIGDQLGIEPPAVAAGPDPQAAAYTPSQGHARAGVDASLAAMSGTDVDALARRVVSMLSSDIVREVVWEVVPEMSETLIREELQKQQPTHPK